MVFGTRADKGGVALVLRTHMNRLLEVNELNQTAACNRACSGLTTRKHSTTPRHASAQAPLTCGHFPQSFEYSTVGGWIVTLGSGQASTYYGDAYDIVFSQEYVTPVGTIKTMDFPAAATGPKVNDILKGSEGTFGILVEVTMKIFRYTPENRRRFASCTHLGGGGGRQPRDHAGRVRPARRIPYLGPGGDRAGPEAEGLRRRRGNAFLSARGFEPGRRCLFVATAEGRRSSPSRWSGDKQIARSHGAMSLTGYATTQWEHGRYSDIHMREDLLDFGIIIDTLETS